ncbi:MAG TPA: type II toxin-antitoxin system VapC family toxin [Burkholderiales bacterium]|jgi:predicted nucleic acid-binding protein
MSVTVVDASAVAAVLFDEPEAAPVIAGVRGALLAPGLLRYELASVCASKLRNEPKLAKLTLQRYRLLPGLDIEYAEPDWDALPLLARQWDLSAYDAAYLQLALKRTAPLITLDARLAGAYDKAAARG